MKRIIVLTIILVTILAGGAHAEEEKIGPYPLEKVRNGCSNLANYTPPPQTLQSMAEMQAMAEQAPAIFTAKYGAYDLVVKKNLGGMQFTSQGNYANLIKSAYGFAAKADKSDMVKFFSVLARPLKTLNGETNNYAFYLTLVALAGEGGAPLEEHHLAFQVMSALELYDFVHAKADSDGQALIAAMFSGDAISALKIVRKDEKEPYMVQSFCINSSISKLL